MTICLAIKCKIKKNGKDMSRLVFASDRQESSFVLKRSVTKLRIMSGQVTKEIKAPWKIVVGSSGDAMVVDEAIDKIGFLLWTKVKPNHKNPSIFLQTWRSEIGDLAYNVYKKFKERGEDPTFSILLGAADEYSSILLVSNTGRTQMLDQFAIIGSGRLTGGELLLSEFLSKQMSEAEAANLAALVVTTVGHVDLAVGGEPDMYICGERRAWKYSERDYREIMEDVETKWDCIKKSWLKMQKDVGFKNKLIDLLK